MTLYIDADGSTIEADHKDADVHELNMCDDMYTIVNDYIKGYVDNVVY
jgi:hypothetical protein